MTAARWLQLSRSPTSTAPAAAAAGLPPVASSPPALHSLDTLVSASVSVELDSTPLAPRTRRSKGADHVRPITAAPATQPISSTALHRTVVSSPPLRKQKRKRRRADAFDGRTEIDSLREAVERWAKQLRRQLLAAAMTNDQRKIRRVADQLRAPPLLRKAAKHRRERCTADQDNACEEGDDEGDNEKTSSTSADRPSASASPSVSTDSDSGNALECTVCAEEPARTEQVWNVSCKHGFCGHCMHARLSQRERKCMYCRESITQVVDRNGTVFQHFEWTRWWRQSQADAVVVSGV